MLSYVLVGSNDISKSKKFYDATLGTLGYDINAVSVNEKECIYLSKKVSFGVIKPIDGQPASHANGGTIAFAAPSSASVDQWQAAGIANGGTACEDPPGIRGDGTNKVYGAYLRDPDGNKICAMYWISSANQD